ncbi:SPFH domain-containing protein [Streptomyces sp. NBC_01789]|uniref:SPFH domain-containing protein n=1 Tax=Streptomyces sp. NBC_01789 TaxID=2975941 RepID=UPI00225A6077|nr:SPFH domain-containing protein [Streptomyces sp. NBC_01789]MCX4448992.1 SPFH domain-containing protein [Streptomyces sp. NBC_01789]
MRSTVSDSSGNPEHGQETEYGEERYGTVPVREWVGPGGAGSVTDAWAAAGTRAVMGEEADAVPEGLPVRGVVPSKDPGPVPPPVFGPVAVSVPAGGEVVVEVPEDRVPADETGPVDAEVRPETGALAKAGDATGSVVDLVLDLVPGEDDRRGPLGATSASVSVPSAAGADAEAGAEEPADAVPLGAVLADAAPTDAVPADAVSASVPEPAPEPEPVAEAPVPGREPVLAGARAGVEGGVGPALVPGPDSGPRTDPLRDSGRHQAVIANERTASIPVHLLFREERNAGAAAVPSTVVRPGGGEPGTGVRRPPVPRTPQVRPATRPAPDADPRLHERPGPALPGWVALLTGLGGTAAAGGVLWWTGALPAVVLARFGLGPRPYDGLGTGAWAALVFLAAVVLFAVGGLTRGRVGHAWVLTLFGQYRGSVRRTGLMWISPLLLRRRIDVRLRHWRSEPLPAVDANGTALRVVVQVVWRVKDTVRAALGIEDHETYLREQVEAAMARVLSQLPADAFHEDAHTLRNAEAVGDALTRMLKADCEPVGVEVYSAQPTGIEYAPEVAAAMQRRRIAAIDAQHRDSVLTSVVDAVDDTVSRLTERGLVELDDYERKSLVKDLTVAFYTGRTGGDGA